MTKQEFDIRIKNSKDARSFAGVNVCALVSGRETRRKQPELLLAKKAQHARLNAP
jgi:hypothetical protein